MKKRHIVFLTGAGISAQSKLETFGDKHIKSSATEGMKALLENDSFLQIAPSLKV